MPEQFQYPIYYGGDTQPSCLEKLRDVCWTHWDSINTDINIQIGRREEETAVGPTVEAASSTGDCPSRISKITFTFTRYFTVSLCRSRIRTVIIIKGFCRLWNVYLDILCKEENSERSFTKTQLLRQKFTLVLYLEYLGVSVGGDEGGSCGIISVVLVTVLPDKCPGDGQTSSTLDT